MTENAASEYIDVDEGLKQSNRDLVGRNKWLTYRLNELKKQADDSANLANDLIHRNETLESNILELKTKLRSLKDVYDNEKEGKNVYELAPGRRPPEGNLPTKEKPSAPPLPENPPHSYPQKSMNFSQGHRHGMVYQRHPPNGRPPHVYPPTNGTPSREYVMNGPRGYPPTAPPPQPRGYPPNGHRPPSYPGNGQQQPPSCYPQQTYSRYPYTHQVPEGIPQRQRPFDHRDIVRPVGLSPNDVSRVSRDYQQPPLTNESRGRQPKSDIQSRGRMQQQMQKNHDYYN